MKKVGMAGGEAGTPDSGKAKNKKRKSTGKKPGQTDSDVERMGSDEEGPGNQSLTGKNAEHGQDANSQTSNKKRKVKHGLDGKPVGAAAPKSDPLAGLLGGKKKAKQSPATIPPRNEQGKKQTHKQQPTVPAVESVTPSKSETKLEPVEAEVVVPTPAPAPTQQLTALQSSLTSKLSSAKFRWLNEQLYTTPSGTAWDLMRSEGGRAFDDVSDMSCLVYQLLPHTHSLFYLTVPQCPPTANSSMAFPSPPLHL